MRAILRILCVVCLPAVLPAQFMEDVVVTSAPLRPLRQSESPGEKIADAEAALERASSQGAQSRETADAASALADLYLKVGDYERASPLIERALEIRLTSLGGKHRDTAASRQQLAEFREELGAFAEAEKLYRGVLSVRQQADSHSVETAATLHALGRLLSKMNNLSEAEQLLRSALAIRQQKLPLNDVETAYSLSELANIEARNGDNSEAKTLLESALKIFETTLGSKDPDTEDARITMQALGETMNEKLIVATQIWDLIPGGPGPEGGKEPATRPLFLSGPFNAREAQRLSDYAEQRLETGNANDRKQALLMQERSLRIRQVVLGPEHPKTLQSLQRLGPAALDQGQYDRALRYAQQAMIVQTHLLRRIFSFTDEQHRLAYQATVSPFSVFASLPDVPARDLATAVLRFKGAVLDSLLAERQQSDASRDPLLRPLLTRAASAREAWHQLDVDAVAAESKDLSVLDARRAALETEFREIMREFARAGIGSGGLAASATTTQIASALAPDALLIEIIRYPHRLEGTRIEDRYGALVIALKGEPKWIPLGSASAIDEKIELYRRSVGYGSRRPAEPRNVIALHEREGDNRNESALHRVLRSLYDQVWVPIEKTLPAGTRKIILSPDGALNFISFATLLNAKDEFLVEKYSIHYVASGRDLLRENEASTTEVLAVFGNPDFDTKSKLIAQQTDSNSAGVVPVSEKQDFKSVSLPQLPGTEEECTELKIQAKALGKPIEVFLGPQATEAQLREVNSPRILHLATHGFFLPEDWDEAWKESGMPVILKNPMRRSGLALAGAENTLKAWAQGKVPPSDNDGILTAEEVGALNLKGTWLVVLSACDTGAGEAKAGEGVLGLRRGFIQAGAQNLLMTLWSISDETTVQIMHDFYDRALASGNAPQSLLDVQREWLVKLRQKRGEEGGLVYAVNRAGPFIMSSQGNAELVGSVRK